MEASEIYSLAVRSTVTIITDKGQGSGFFVEQNIIVTNYHVIKGATKAFCSPDNFDQQFEIKGYIEIDEIHDLAILYVEELDRPPLPLSEMSISPGEKVFVIGSPVGFSATISEGIVSSLRDYEDSKFIQITAPVSHGSSGGPVFNTYGKVVGVVIAGVDDAQNLNFAIPIDYLKLLLNFKGNYYYAFSNTKENHSDTQKKPSQESSKESISDESNSIIYKMDMVSNTNENLKLDYYIDTDENDIFLFSYSLNSNRNSQYLSLDSYKFIDINSGAEYDFKWSNLTNNGSPRVIYSNTTTGFVVAFNNLPNNVQSFKLSDGYCDLGSFCFSNINLNNEVAAEENELDDVLDFYKYGTYQGTVSFYLQHDEPQNIKFYIEDIFVGELNHSISYGENLDCGGIKMLNVRLYPGEYHYTAIGENNSWEGTFTIFENECTQEGLIIY